MGVYGITRQGGHVGRLWSGDVQAELLGDGGCAGEIASSTRSCSSSGPRRGCGSIPTYRTSISTVRIVQTAVSVGRSAHVVACPVVHNTVPVASLSGGFTAGYRFLQRKWSTRLPIVTSMTTITRAGLPLLRARARHRWYARKAKRLGNHTTGHGCDRAGPQDRI